MCLIAARMTGRSGDETSGTRRWRAVRYCYCLVLFAFPTGDGDGGGGLIVMSLLLAIHLVIVDRTRTQ